MSAARYAEDFMVTVVVGDDVVSRMSLANLYDMKIKILKIIKDADITKVDIRDIGFTQQSHLPEQC